MSKKQKTYTAEFKAEAIKAIEENQGNVSESARQLGISMQTLSNWNNKAKAGTWGLGSNGTKNQRKL